MVIMLKSIAGRVGRPGMLLVCALIVGLVGSLGTLLVAPMAAIPFFDLFALLFDPFPTIACYSAAALLAYLGMRGILWLLRINRSIAQWVAMASAVILIVGVGYLLPVSWNSAAGLVPTVPQSQPALVAIPNGGAIALVDYGDPRYVRCDAICLSLLIQERVQFVEVASTLHEPSLFEALPGKRYMLNAQTRNCMKGKQDYAFADTEALRHQVFIDLGSLPIEYDTCLDSREMAVKPEQQTTIVEWTNGGNFDGGPKVGFSGPVGVIRTIVPQGAHQPAIHEARYRAGYRYFTPLYLESYAGNAASGAYFSPTMAITYFSEPGFPDTLEPRFWKSLTGSEELGSKTASWLDHVVERRQPAQP